MAHHKKSGNNDNILLAILSIISIISFIFLFFKKEKKETIEEGGEEQKQANPKDFI